MNKIMVIGPSGAGKSTFSRILAKKLNIPLYPLDNIFWNEKKEHISRDEFDSRLGEILKENKWVIDGDYSRTYEVRMKQADTIFFMDFSLETCLHGVESRVGTKREDCPFIENEFDEEFRKWIIDWFDKTRPGTLSLLSKYNDKNIIVFKSREESDKYLADMTDLNK